MTDANVWIALATDRHQHHAAARHWFSSLGEQEAVFCRVTQMSFLRLLSNRAVMGEDWQEPLAAWRTYRNLRRDWRLDFASEPAGLEEIWIDLMRQAPAGTVWTDAYLAAFAIGHSCRLVSFDRGFARWPALAFLPLGPSRRL